VKLNLGKSIGVFAAGNQFSTPHIGVLVGIAETALVVTLKSGVRDVNTAALLVALVHAVVERSGIVGAN